MFQFQRQSQSTDILRLGKAIALKYIKLINILFIGLCHLRRQSYV